MANFPTRETDIVRLAQDVSNGLTANAAMFPTPPVEPVAIDAALAAYSSAREAAISSSAVSVQNTKLKDAALEALVAILRSILRYAEATARNDDGKLQLLGWGARRPRTPSEALQIPGQVATLEVKHEGKNGVTLGWQEPFDGGEVDAYRIQRRKRDGDWVDVGTSVHNTIALNGQDAGVEWEYQVIALNKAGEGLASNVVRAVL